jgi:hypothetical protein
MSIRIRGSIFWFIFVPVTFESLVTDTAPFGIMKLRLACSCLVALMGYAPMSDFFDYKFGMWLLLLPARTLILEKAQLNKN